MHLVHVFPSFQLGGSQRRFAALANHFGERYRHTIISLDGCRDALSLLEPHAPQTLLPGPPKSGLVSTLFKARKVLRALKPDALVTYNWGAMEWAAAGVLSGLRHIHIEDGFGPEEAKGQIRRRVLFRRIVLNFKSTVVLPSQTLVDIAAGIWRIAPQRITYIPNGIPCVRFRQAASGAPVFRGHGPVIGTVATLRKEKALDRLILAFQDVLGTQPARLVIVGDGPERSALEELVCAAGLSRCVTFTGSLSQPEKAVAAFDVFALSSDTEQMPLSVLEAMAAGLPVAATDVGDVRAMVAAENHPFITRKDAGALSSALGALLEDPKLRRRVGAENRAKAEREYDEAAMFLRYEQIFSGHAGNAPTQSPNAASLQDPRAWASSPAAKVSVTGRQ
jgi:glycosyltransferase involved in cell wall biosynthesis